MEQLLETLMVVSFGLSWPNSILKSYRARTAKGKSLMFLSLILFGYVCGITAKLLSGNMSYVFFFYVLNALMLCIEIGLYFRNRAFDRAAAQDLSHR
ncbi:MAG: hypothetical protein ABT01_01235 [Clostridium sp. SCN 57-10]|nr:MAG: hypothetical protein ABT01_01235 [Clostridium sp. SCN 57-10]